MNIRILTVGSLASVTIVSGAFAQTAPYSWTGFYAGVAAGASIATNDSRKAHWSPDGACSPGDSVCFAAGQSGLVPYGTASGAPLLGSTPMTPETSPFGWPSALKKGAVQQAFGLSLEYKRQIHPHVVIGIENQFFGLGPTRAASWTQAQNFGPYGSISGHRNDALRIAGGAHWLDFVTEKIGYAQDRTLFYARGGLAFGEVGMTTSAISSEAIQNAGYLTGDSVIDTSWAGKSKKLRAGFALGGGVEHALTDDVTLRLDATYFDLGTAKVTARGSSMTTNTGLSPPLTAGAGTPQAYTAAKRIDGLVTSIGINFRY